MGTISQMSRKGDVTIAWDPENEEETAAARAVFEELKEKHFMPFELRGFSTRGEQIDEFDPDADRIVFVAPMAGGRIQDDPEFQESVAQMRRGERRPRPY